MPSYNFWNQLQYLNVRALFAFFVSIFPYFNQWFFFGGNIIIYHIFISYGYENNFQPKKLGIHWSFYLKISVNRTVYFCLMSFCMPNRLMVAMFILFVLCRGRGQHLSFRVYLPILENVFYSGVILYEETESEEKKWKNVVFGGLLAFLWPKFS